MPELIIKYLDPVESWMSPDMYNFVIKELSYPAKFFKPGRFHKIRKDYEAKNTIIGKMKDGGFLFYTGLIPRIQEYCGDRGQDISIMGIPTEEIKLSTTEISKGLNFRSFQEEFIRTGIKIGRGVFIAPTGTGKTILGIGLISYLWEHYKILWLCHTKSLLMQSAKEAENIFGPGSVGIVGDDHYDIGKYVTVATRQTFYKHATELSLLFDVVIVDEAHHITSLASKEEGGKVLVGQYFNILRQILCPIRFGLTATRADTKAAQLAMESMLGPVIGEFTINEAREQGYMATPRIKVKKLDMNPTVKDMRKYSDVYDAGVIRNLQMNRDIADTVKWYADQGAVSLVIVKAIVHGELILNMCKRLGIKAEFINGSTETQTRELIKYDLNNHKIDCGICTSVWKEGVNIPELDALFNAAQGKSELGTLQALGRGLRRTDTKTDLFFHDYFNPSHRFLIEHFGQRLCLYMDNNWL